MGWMSIKKGTSLSDDKRLRNKNIITQHSGGFLGNSRRHFLACQGEYESKETAQSSEAVLCSGQFEGKVEPEAEIDPDTCRPKGWLRGWEP